MARTLILRCVAVRNASVPPPEMLASLVEGWSDVERADFRAEMVARHAGENDRLRRARLWKRATEAERAFLEADADDWTEQQRIDASWCGEAAGTLLWALGEIDALPPFDVEHVPENLDVLPDDPPAKLMRRARLRSGAEIETAREVSELWHWRSHTHRLSVDGFFDEPGRLPDGLSIDEVIERVVTRMAAGANWSDVWRHIAHPGQAVEVLLARQGRIVRQAVTPGLDPFAKVTVDEVDEPTSDHLEHRRSWWQQPSA